MTDHPDKSDEVHRWRAHPARERLTATAGAVTLILMLGIGSSIVAGTMIAGLAAVLLLVLSLRRYFFPSEYEIDGDGVTARYALGSVRQAWPEVRRCVADDRGVFISRRVRASRLDAYTGCHLLPGRGGRPSTDDIARTIRARMSADGMAS